MGLWVVVRGRGCEPRLTARPPPSSPAPRRQYPLGFALSFSRWMCRHPELYRLQAEMNSSELTVTGDLITKGTRVLVSTHPGWRDGGWLLLIVPWQQHLPGVLALKRGLMGWEKQGVSLLEGRC